MCCSCRNQAVKSLRTETDSLMTTIIIILLALGIYTWLIFGVMDLTNSSMIGAEANYSLLGSIGLLLGVSSIVGLYAVQQESLVTPLLVGIVLVVLSVAFAHFSPTRLGTFLHHGDPAHYSPALSGSTGMLMMLKAGFSEIRRRNGRKKDQ